jgi:hypothetical protein
MTVGEVTTMQKTTLTILTVGLLSAVGIGAYELGNYKSHNDLSAYTLQPSSIPPATTSASLMTQPQSSSAAPLGTLPPLQTGTTSVLPQPAPQANLGPMTNTSSRPTLQTETPTAAMSPALPDNSYVQNKETTTNVVTTAPHRAYVHRRVAYRRSDKVHIGRAVKHTAEFALKLPGRASL